MPTENRSSTIEQHDHIEVVIDMVSVQATIESLEEAYAGDRALGFMNDAAQLLRHLKAISTPHPHPEPIAWMVGTAIWWTKEEAERDAAATGLPIVGLGPMTGFAPVEQHQGDPVGTLLIEEYFDNREVGEVDVQLDSKLCEQLAEKYPGQSLPLYTHADPGEVERLSKATAFVQRLVDCSGTQPSVATGYLRDILDELKGNTTPTAPVDRDERAAFEHHHRICDLMRDEDCPEDYRNQSVQDSWEGWQARAEQEIRP